MSISNEVKQQIIIYEKMLQSPKKFSVDELSQLIDESFSEIGRSANIYNKEQIINHFDKLKASESNKDEIKMTGVEFKIISEEVILLTYKAREVDISGKKVTCSLRSSLWKSKHNHWVLMFHQATRIN